MKLSGTRRAVLTAVAATLAAALSLPAIGSPRHSGGHAERSGGHSAGHYSGGHSAGHYVSGYPAARHYGGARYYAPRVGVYLGVPLIAAAAYYGPRYYYPPAYVAPPPQVLYYCAAYNDYYPRVPVCPSGWQQVIQPPGAPYY